MNPYQKAVDALKECVVDAINSNVDTNTQGEIWRHYQGMKAIEKQLKRSNLSFKLDGVDRVMEMYDSEYPTQAAQPVDIGIGGFGQGNDVITFS
jgi:hypothetical protein